MSEINIIKEQSNNNQEVAWETEKEIKAELKEKLSGVNLFTADLLMTNEKNKEEIRAEVEKIKVSLEFISNRLT